MQDKQILVKLRHAHRERRPVPLPGPLRRPQGFVGRHQRFVAHQGSEIPEKRLGHLYPDFSAPLVGSVQNLDLAGEGSRGHARAVGARRFGPEPALPVAAVGTFPTRSRGHNLDALHGFPRPFRRQTGTFHIQGTLHQVLVILERARQGVLQRKFQDFGRPGSRQGGRAPGRGEQATKALGQGPHPGTIAVFHTVEKYFPRCG